MTLKEMKIKTFSLIEEYYPNETLLAEDEDVRNKINSVINEIQMDLMPLRKLPTYEDIEIEKEDDREIIISDSISDMYQLDKIELSDKNYDYTMPNDDTIVLEDGFEGTIRIYYFKYPKLVKIFDKNATDSEISNYDEKFKFDLDPILLEIMPMGVGAELLKMDMINNYGEYFHKRYLEMKQSIDTRRTAGIIKIEGGYDI